MSQAARRAIYGRMAGDTTLNNLLATPPTGRSKSIYYQLAVEDAGLPFVLFQKQAGRPSYAMNKAKTMESDLWLVKAVHKQEEADTADVIAARIDALLTDGTVSISGGTQLYLRRESDVDYSELDNGVRYIHAGSLYRLIYQTT